jgi:tRNA(fMet)-specific endonuclease VapC
MPARYLLDTNTCIAVMRHHQSAVQHMAAHPPSECGISAITSYELYTGVEKCSQPMKERAKVDLLLQTVSLLAFESTSAKEAARIRALLEAQGQPIGPYDWLLAGQALANSQVLVTANMKEIARVPGLAVENWQ